MRFYRFQEYFHTLLIITNDDKNKNTNECIEKMGKLIAILTFRVHINVKSLFYLLFNPAIIKHLKLSQVGVGANMGGASSKYLGTLHWHSQDFGSGWGT